MLCDECGASFDASEAVTKLISMGEIPCVCDACAKPAPEMFTSARPTVPTVRTKNSVLRRVDKFDSEGVSLQWMSLMPDYPKPGKKRIPRPGRPGDNLRVFVMSEKRGQLTGRPRTILHTNLELFQRRGEAFKAWKAPGRADALTGIDRIELEATNLKRVVDDGSLEVNIYGKDGTRIRLIYKN